MPDDTIYLQLTFWQEDSPANPSRSPGNGAARKTSAGFGLSLPVSLANYDPESHSWRMFQACLLPGEQLSLLTLPRWGMTRNGVLYRLPPPVLPTAENDGFAWPTPVQPNGGRSIPEQARWSGKAAYLPNGKKLQVDLDQAVRNWPTPQSRDYRSPDDPESPRVARKVEQGWSFNLNDVVNWPTPRVAVNRTSRSALTAKQWAAPSLEQAIELSEGILPREYETIDELPPVAQRMWPTPSAMNPNENEDLETWATRRAEIKAQKKNGNGFGMPLGVAARLWGCPQARDFRSSDIPGRQTPSLPVQTGGCLNPAWVETLQGFPEGWTDIGGPLGQVKRSTNGKRREP